MLEIGISETKANTERQKAPELMENSGAFCRMIRDQPGSSTMLMSQTNLTEDNSYDA